MNNIRTLSVPHTSSEGRRVFLGKLIASLALSTTGLAARALAQQESNESSLHTLPNPASDDAEGGGIDNLPIEQQIAQVKLKIQILEAKTPREREDVLELIALNRELAELENQRQALGQQTIDQQEATIDDLSTQLVEVFEDIQDTLEGGR